MPIRHLNITIFFLLFFLFLIACPPVYAVEQTKGTELSSNNTSCIYIADNAKIYGKEHLIVKKNTPQTFAIKTTKTESKTTKPVENNVDKKEPSAVVFPDFPYFPSSTFYLNNGTITAVITSKQRFCGCRSACLANQDYRYSDIRNQNISVYLPKQRQKLSFAAVQCGILTNFSPHSPNLSYFLYNT